MTPDAVPYLDGHCYSGHGRPDQHHDLCPGEFTSPFGVRHVCSCPGHEKED